MTYNLDAVPTRFRKTFNWHMTTGKTVVIRAFGAFIRQGVVEDVMPDSAGLWLGSNPAEPRQYFDKASGFEVWIPAYDSNQGDAHNC